jgi:hypothetical protein
MGLSLSCHPSGFERPAGVDAHIVPDDILAVVRLELRQSFIFALADGFNPGGKRGGVSVLGAHPAVVVGAVAGFVAE